MTIRVYGAREYVNLNAAKLAYRIPIIQPKLGVRNTRIPSAGILCT
jgi:hypothetical protein